MEEYIINANNYLRKNTKAYYTLEYHGGKNESSTQFIRDLKNLYADFDNARMNNAKARAAEILAEALPFIKENERISSCTIVAVPRAKAFESYLPEQLYLIETISKVAKSLNNVVDGTTSIKRHTNTKTTHLPREIGRTTARGNIYKGENANDGEEPYPGITNDTCDINTDYIKGQTVILVDDIYTGGCNIDEDCIQALYDAGAEKVIFYSLAKTVRRDQ